MPKVVISLKELAITISVLIIIGGIGYYVHAHQPWHINQKINQSAAKTVNNSRKANNRIRILAAGDFIAHDSVNANAKQADGSYNYLPMMDDFTEIFHNADIRFCNDANLNGGPQFGIGGYPKFNSPTEFVRDMARVGCNLVNDGTNHSFDRNQAAINASVDAWNKQPDMLAVVGENRNQSEHDNVHLFSLKGMKFAFLAYTTYLNNDAPAQNNYGVNVYSNDYAASQIKQAQAAGAQYIIVSIRWGVEYSQTVSDAQRQVAQFLADHGVNLILGHGSHELQPVQTLTGSGDGKTIVWYSLGNVLNTQLPPETLFNGLGVIDIDPANRQATNISFLPLYMHYEWSADQAKNQDLLARHNLKMYLLENATQSMIDAQQLNTSVSAQNQRLSTTLNTYMKIPLITRSQYFQ